MDDVTIQLCHLSDVKFISTISLEFVLARGVCPHSLLTFNTLSGNAALIFTASLIRLRVASFLYTLVTFMLNLGEEWCLCAFPVCFQIGED